jgi:hypothetical protein
MYDHSVTFYFTLITSKTFTKHWSSKSGESKCKGRKKEAKRLFGAIARFTEIVLDPRGLKTVEMGEAKIWKNVSLDFFIKCNSFNPHILLKFLDVVLYVSEVPI